MRSWRMFTGGKSNEICGISFKNAYYGVIFSLMGNRVMLLLTLIYTLIFQQGMVPSFSSPRAMRFVAWTSRTLIIT